MLYRILLLSWCVFVTSVSTYPIESKPLNNNPESWNLSWLVFTPRNSSDPSAEALVSSDPHIKKSKITPKSIFIAPSSYNSQDKICPHGYRIDDNGKCIKTVTINQDDILAARLSDLFGVDTNSNNKNTNVDSDYYDFDEDKNDGENSGPLQINLPLTIDVEEESNDGKKIEYIIEEKVITMRNLNPKNVQAEASEDFTTIVPAPITEKLIADDIDITTTTTMSPTTEIPIEEQTTTVEPITTTIAIETTVFETTTTAPEIISTTTVRTTTKTTTTTTEKPPIIILPSIEPYKINSVEFMPKTRKSNRNRNKSTEKRIRRPRPQQQSLSIHEESSILKSQQQQQYMIEPLPIPKKNRTRVNAKRRKIPEISTTTTTESPISSSSHKPYFWLPKGWTIDESTKEKPVLIRFWAEQPHDERARSHHSRHQRVNSKMPTEGIFREVTVPELERLVE
ncbi:hypothetical protein PVAND_005353 [Polypedilum vanderplanki]|uniref:Folded gastrulation N-terminal domain-containing protein n=1 Tax=Polypedilum vanderplanki TaxID=319348 RepID=A0A9J6BZP5_POLVA|nr:hypothetical protein PVAND_005353 [Polypedilum vanderplanki]